MILLLIRENTLAWVLAFLVAEGVLTLWIGHHVRRYARLTTGS